MYGSKSLNENQDSKIKKIRYETKTIHKMNFLEMYKKNNKKFMNAKTLKEKFQKPLKTKSITKKSANCSCHEILPICAVMKRKFVHF